MPLSEEVHRITLSNISDAVFLTDSKGDFCFVCPNVHVIFGYDEAEVSEMRNIRRLLGDLLATSSLLKQQGEVSNIERRILDKKGRPHILLVNVKSVEIQGPKRLYTCRDISDRKRLEAQMEESTEKERRRIGQDLHDGICQQLAGLECILQSLEEETFQMQHDSLTTEMRRVKQMVRDTNQDVRRLIKDLSPVPPGPEGLAYALQNLAQRVSEQHQVDCQFQQEGGEMPDLPSLAATHLYRITQEAVHNALRHGKANHVILSLRRQPDHGVLEVTDNGSGLPPEGKMSGGLGLSVMRHRAQHIHALDFSIDNHAEGGVRVFCKFPWRNLPT